MAKKDPKKEPPSEELEEEFSDEEPVSDPYLNELDSSLEDLMAEEPTSFDVPAPEEPVEGGAPAETAPVPPEAIPPDAVGGEETVNLVADIPVELRVVIGEKQTTLADLLEMKKGEIMELAKGLEGAVDLMVQDKVVARGELVEVDGKLAVRVLRVLAEPKSTKESR